MVNAIKKMMSTLVVHLVMKVLSFGLTVLITRTVGAHHKGIGFAFEMYINAVAFLAKEATRGLNARNSLSSSAEKSSGKNKKDMFLHMMRTGSMSFLIFLVLLPLFSTHAAFFQPAEFLSVCSPRVVAAYVVGLAVELCAEPALAVLVATGDFGARVFSDAVSVFCRLFVTAGLFRYWWMAHYRSQETDDNEQNEAAALVYGLGYCVATSVTTILVWYRLRKLRNSASADQEQTAALTSSLYSFFFVDRVVTAPFTAAKHIFVSTQGAPQRGLFLQLGRESILRHVLNEAEKLFLTAQGNLEAQGIFDTVGSLGAMVVRLLFRPLEDFTGAVWSKESTDKTEHLSLLKTTIRLVLSIGVVAVVVGPPLATLFLGLLYGGNASWTSPLAVSVLSLYCWYIPLMGVNGLVEAFVRSTADVNQLKSVQHAMLVCSCLYCVASYFAIRRSGVEGMIIVNCVNTALRIGVSSRFSHHTITQRWKISKPEYGLMLPSYRLLLCAALTFTSTRFYQERHSIVLTLPVIGGARLPELLALGGAAVCASVFVLGDLREQVQAVRKQRKKQKDQ